MVAFSSLNPFQHSSRTTLSLVVGVAAFWFTTSVIRKLQWNRKLPPGPWGWPLVGHLFSIGSRPDYYFMQISEKFGKLFSLRVASRLVVVMSDPDIVRQAFVHKASFTSDRQRSEGGWLAFGHDNDWALALSSGETWKIVRRVVTPALRDVGPSGSTMESIIVEEANHLVEQFSGHGNESFDPRESVTRAISNVICSLIYGARFDYDDARFHDIINAVDVIMRHPYGKRALLENFPFLFFSANGRPLREAWRTIKKHMIEAVSVQEKNLDRDNIKSLVEKILIENQAGVSGGKHSGIDTRVIWRLLIDLIIGGTDTTANTLQWALLIMAHNPDVQKKVHNEIDSVIGFERDPSKKDRNLMPYTHATLLEVLRHRPVGPLAVPHIVSETISLRGYTIPKGTMLFVNVWSIHHDAEYWDEPDTFDPERFIEDSVNIKRNLPAYLPFGIGPRICAGESIAKLELFLVFTKLMQRFHIDFAPGQKPDVFDDGVYNEVTLNPRGMKIRMILR